MTEKKKLIDAGLLYDKLQSHLEFLVKPWRDFGLELPRKERVRTDEIVNCMAEIVNSPAVDAMEVVHGRWIEFNLFMTCSECDTDWYYTDNDTDRFNYCPNCGAKMDGDRDA